MRMIVVMLAVLIAFPLPASAHTEAEQREWQAEWTLEVKKGGLTRGLLAEYLDFQERHAPPPPAPPPTVRSTTSPTAASSSPNRGLGSNVEQWRSLVSQYFSGGDVDTALCLMGYESGGNPNAKNPTSSARGLMQILASLWAPHYGVSYEALYDPATNLSIAAKIKAAQGWGAWSPYGRGLCR